VSGVIPESMDGDNSHISARVDTAQKETYRSAARRLKVDLTTLMLCSLDAVSSAVLEEGWECRQVYLVEGRIVGYGAEPPLSARGVPLPASSHTLVAPSAFWTEIERSLRR
jgi:hypothetical protein